MTLVLLAGASWLPRCAAADRLGGASEYSLKAMFLLNFTKFVEWPDQAFSGNAAPFVVGVIGEDPFGSVLDEAFAHQTVGGRSVVIRRYTPGTLGIDCQVLFVARSIKDQQPALLQDLRGRPVLTVGEADQFLESGGMINFVVIKERVRFEINAMAADRTGLNLGAKLLGVAVRVISSKRPAP